MFIRNAKMAGMYQFDQLDIVREYFDKFFEVLPAIVDKQTWRYLENFFHAMLPTMEITDSHIVKLVALKNDTADSQ